MIFAPFERVGNSAFGGGGVSSSLMMNRGHTNNGIVTNSSNHSLFQVDTSSNNSNNAIRGSNFNEYNTDLMNNHRVSPIQNRLVSRSNNRFYLRREDSVLHMFSKNENTNNNDNTSNNEKIAFSQPEGIYNKVTMKLKHQDISFPSLPELTKTSNGKGVKGNLLCTSSKDQSSSVEKQKKKTIIPSPDGVMNRNSIESSHTTIEETAHCKTKDIIKCEEDAIVAVNDEVAIIKSNIELPTISSPTRSPSSKAHFQSVKQRRRLALLVSSISHQGDKSPRCRDTSPVVEAKHSSFDDDKTLGIKQIGPKDQQLETINTIAIRSQSDVPIATTTSNTTTHVCRRVHFCLPKGNCSHKKQVKRKEDITEREKRLDDAIKRAYFYSKKERKVMRQNAFIVMENYIDDHPRKIGEMKQFYVDCRNSNMTNNNSNSPGDYILQVQHVMKLLNKKELNFIRDWSSSDVRGLEDLIHDYIFMKERVMAIQAVLGYQEYYVQQQQQTWNDIYQGDDDEYECYYNSDEPVNGGCINNRQEQEQRKNDRFHEAMRNRSLSVSRRSREFAIKVAIGDALEAKTYYDSPSDPK